MFRYLGQWIRNRTVGPVLPLELIFFVTGRCTFRCKHCFLQEFTTDANTDISLDAVDRLAFDLPNLMVLMLTGGEPFLRQDLPEIVSIFSEKSRPRVISIATNGFLTDRIVASVTEILEQPRFQAQLLVTLSFEGIDENHDAGRGTRGAFAKALITAKELKTISANKPNLAVGANITLIRENAQTVMATARELAATNLFSFLTHNLYRERKPKTVFEQVDLEVYRDLGCFVRSYSRAFSMGASRVLGLWHYFKESYQGELISRIVRARSYQGLPCAAGRDIGVVYHDGDVAPCELLPPWGNLKEHSFAEIWGSQSSRSNSRKLRHDKCFCTHECFLSCTLNTQLTPLVKCLMWNIFRRGPAK